ncbi:adenosylcobinamide-GDP ribazoletransferase [Paenibacillus abyssi]|uniref:Adenosylcobinamide-GDP ribazoletransferase n=1 Tax=Paenibacillus abyssi TaxID=1340531 RepID=A0A917FV66_9BACL|nr:adenosylcobinamide-GDP ribazoletransferase [Paenibacillus abyssi]GGG11620.1 adenosylcobinamide-GDP ribazoletransferase [Paenibacillus abyssi]
MVSHYLLRWVQAFITALQFLTRLPIPLHIAFTNETTRRSVVFFPFAGLLIGLLVTSSGAVLQHLLPALPAAVMMLAVWVALSGGLHLDGWMDTADGVLSHRSRERMLEIMKDSRVGAMGVIAGVLLLLLKFALLSAQLEQQLSWIVMGHLIAIPVWSRLAMAMAMVGWRMARGSEGMAGLFGGVGTRHLMGSCAVTLTAILTVYLLMGMSPGAAMFYLVAAFIITIIASWGMGWWLNRKLGGLTGDTYGAINEAVEVVLLIALAIWMHL